MVGINDGTVWWSLITSLRTRSWTVQATEPRIVQVLLTSHCRQLEHSILRYLRCTLPAPPSYPASRNTRTHTHTPFMQAVQTVQTDCMYTGTKFRFTRFTASFRSKAPKICWDPTASKLDFLACFVSTAYIFFDRKSEVENKNPDLIGRDLNHLRNKLR